MAQSFSVNGYVEDVLSGERIPSVNVYLVEERAGTSSNEFGYFNLNMGSGCSKVSVSHVIYTTLLLDWCIQKDSIFVIEMSPRIASLDSLIITPPISGDADGIQMSRHQLSAAEVESMPSILGEADVIKVIQLLPGAKPGREGFNDLYVRGGQPDQNLILLDGLSLYNPNHILGLFGVFNPSILKQIEFIKGGFPARFGGRLSSVINLTTKDGNLKHYGGEGKLGLLTSRLMIEGPIIKERASIIISGRRTFLDQVARWFQPKQRQESIFFYDLNVKTNLILSNRDRIYVSGYFGGDQFMTRTRPTRESAFSRNTNHKVEWRNQLLSLRWHRLVGDQVFMSVTMGTVGYDVINKFRSRQAIETDSSESFRSSWTSSVRDYTLRFNAEYKPTRHHNVRFGGEITSHTFKPSSTQSVLINQQGEQPRSQVRESASIMTTEYATYLEDEIYLFENITAHLGIRYSGGRSDGQHAYAVEPRGSVKFSLTHELDAKVSYAFVKQYLHRLRGVGSSISREVWIPFMSGIRPKTSSQIAIGVASRLPRHGIELTLEGYYKHIDDQIEYQLDTLPYQASSRGWPNIVEHGRGTSYGIEFMVRRQNHRFNGWINYSWSHAHRVFLGLNDGMSFHDNYDRRHDISIVGQYQVTQFTSVSASWVYSSGYPLWLPSGRYYDPINDVGWFEYGRINATRSPASHRLDLTARFTKQIKWGKRTFSLGLFNVYNRRNPMYVYPQVNIYGTIRWERVTLLQLIPDFSYAIQF